MIHKKIKKALSTGWQSIREAGSKLDDNIRDEVPGGWVGVAAIAAGGYLAYQALTATAAAAGTAGAGTTAATTGSWIGAGSGGVAGAAEIASISLAEAAAASQLAATAAAGGASWVGAGAGGAAGAMEIAAIQAAELMAGGMTASQLTAAGVSQSVVDAAVQYALPQTTGGMLTTPTSSQLPSIPSGTGNVLPGLNDGTAFVPAPGGLTTPATSGWDAFGNFVSSPGGGNLVSAGLNVLGGVISGNKAADAAQAQSDAIIRAAEIAADAARFRPVGISTRFGTSKFGFDEKGNLSSAGYTLSPDMRLQQNRLMGASEGALDQYLAAQAGYQATPTIAQLYRDNLGREPEAGGLQNWTNQFGPTATQDQAAQFRRAALPELSMPRGFANGGLNPSDTVPAMLTPGEFVLNAEAARNIGHGQLNQLNQQGMMSRRGYADGGAVHPQTVAELYQQILGRAPDAGGLAHWQQQFGSSVDAAELAQFRQAAAPELAGRTPTSAIESLYQTNLGRASDPAGLVHWQNRFGAEIDDDERAQFTAASAPELAIRDAYQTNFGRPFDQAGADYWMQQGAGNQNYDYMANIRAAAQGQDMLARDDTTRGTGITFGNASLTDPNLRYDATANKWGTPGGYGDGYGPNGESVEGWVPVDRARHSGEPYQAPTLNAQGYPARRRMTEEDRGTRRQSATGIEMEISYGPTAEEMARWTPEQRAYYDNSLMGNLPIGGQRNYMQTSRGPTAEEMARWTPTGGSTLPPQSPEMQQWTASQTPMGQSTTAPMGQAAQGMMNLGMGYLGTSPQAQAQQYMREQQALVATGRERDFSQLQTAMFNQGRGGMAYGGTSTGMQPSNPQLEAYYNALRQQDLGMAANATQGGMDYARFGAEMVGGGGGMLRGMYDTQVSAFRPYETALGGATRIEGLGQSAMDMGSALGARTSTAGANVGQLLSQGTQAAAPYGSTARSYSPWGTALSGAGNAWSEYNRPAGQQAMFNQYTGARL